MENSNILTEGFFSILFDKVRGKGNDNNTAVEFLVTMYTKLGLISKGSSFYNFYMDHVKNNVSNIRKLIESGECNVDNVLENEKFIQITIVEPMLNYWFQTQFKKKFVFFYNQKTGSRKVNGAIYQALEEFISDAGDNPKNRAFKGAAKSLINNIKSRAKALDSDSEESVVPLSKCAVPTSENISKMVISDLYLNEADRLDENFFKKNLARIKNLLSKISGNAGLKQLIFKVADELGLSYEVIVYVTNNIGFANGGDLTTTRKSARNNERINVTNIARIVSRGIALYMYEQTGTPNQTAKLFSDPVLAKFASNTIKNMMSDRDFHSYITDFTNQEIAAIVNKIQK